MHAFGALWLSVEITAFFSEPMAQKIPPFWWAFLATGAIVGLLRAWPRVSVSCRIRGTDCHIDLRICDMLGQSGSYIIGSNTTFDTSLEDKTISERSVQGQFTKRFFPSLSQLNRELADSLAGVESTELSAIEKPYGKRTRYEIGSVAMVRYDRGIAYFLAVANLNANRVASASRQDVLDALPKLWEFIRTRGSIEPICSPILGTGFSRTNATRDDIAREMIRSFVAACQAGRFSERLTIAIAPADYRAGTVDFPALVRFLENACEEANLPPSQVSSAAKGQPLGA